MQNKEKLFKRILVILSAGFILTVALSSFLFSFLARLSCSDAEDTIVLKPSEKREVRTAEPKVVNTAGIASVNEDKPKEKKPAFGLSRKVKPEGKGKEVSISPAVPGGKDFTLILLPSVGGLIVVGLLIILYTSLSINKKMNAAAEGSVTIVRTNSRGDQILDVLSVYEMDKVTDVRFKEARNLNREYRNNFTV